MTMLFSAIVSYVFPDAWLEQIRQTVSLHPEGKLLTPVIVNGKDVKNVILLVGLAVKYGTRQPWAIKMHIVAAQLPVTEFWMNVSQSPKAYGLAKLYAKDLGLV